MIELTLRVSLDHPLVRFTRRHASVRGNVYCEEARGGTFTQEIVQGGRAVLQEYVRELGMGAPTGCGRHATIREKQNHLVVVTGPCVCGGTLPECAPLEDLRASVQRLLPGRVRLVELGIERGRVLAHVRYFEDALPELPDRMQSLVQVGRAGVLHVLTASRVQPLPEGGFLAGRLDDVESATLRVAQRLGYYEKPRRATMDDLARELGITKSAVCHRLNKLEQKAIRRMMSSQGSGEQLAVVAAHAPAEWPHDPMPAR